MALHEILRSEIDKRGMRYKYVAEKLGISAACLHGYLSGKNKMKTPLIIAFCHQFDVDLSVFGLDEFKKSA